MKGKTMKPIGKIFIAISMNIVANFFCYSMDNRTPGEVVLKNFYLQKLKSVVDTIKEKGVRLTETSASLQIQPEIAAKFDQLALQFVTNLNNEQLLEIYKSLRCNHDSGTFFLNDLFMYVFVNKQYYILNKKLVFDPVLFSENRLPVTLFAIFKKIQTQIEEHKSHKQSYSVTNSLDYLSMVLFYEIIKYENIIEKIQHLTCSDKKTSCQFYFSPKTGNLEQYVKMDPYISQVTFEAAQKAAAYIIEEEVRGIEIVEIGCVF